MKTKWIGALSAVAAVTAASGAQAQTAATVKEIVRVVKTGKPASPDLADAKVNMPLAIGDRVRTGGRSGAGLRFADQSLLRLGEMTEVVVTSRSQRDLRVTRGKVFANYQAPGTIRGGYAVAAVRGTHVLYVQDDVRKRAEVHCFKGRVFVSSADNPISAGTSDQVTATTLTDPGLGDTDTDWIGGEIRFVDGPYVGQTRRVSGFNRQTGAVEFNPPLPNAPMGGDAGGGVRLVANQPRPGGGPTGYLLVKNPNMPVRLLTDNTGTTVRLGQAPTIPYNVPSEEFAMMQRNPFFAEGQQYLVTTPGTQEHQSLQEEEFAQREAINNVLLSDLLAGEDCGGQPLPPGGFERRRRTARMGVRSALNRQFTYETQERGEREPGRAIRPEDIFLPENVQTPLYEEPEEGQKSNFRLEPFFFASEGNNALGARLRFQGTSGDAYAELGYRYTLLNGSQSLHDISEGFLHLRGHHGQLIAGRQHLFLGPANNNRFGTLLGLETTDAVVYELPLKGGFRQQVGWLIDTQALRDRGFAGGFARGQAPFRGGYVGYSVLASTHDDHTTGWSIDFSQPLIKNKVDVYGEGGRGVGGRNLAMAGLYFPALYHTMRVDAFLEYANREDLMERVSLRLRREMGNGLLLVAFLDRRLGEDNWDSGIGALWSYEFR